MRKKEELVTKPAIPIAEMRRGSIDQNTMDEIDNIMAEDYNTKHLEALLDSYVGEKYAANIKNKPGKQLNLLKDENCDKPRFKETNNAEDTVSKDEDSKLRAELNMDLGSMCHSHGFDLSSEINIQGLEEDELMNIVAKVGSTIYKQNKNANNHTNDDGNHKKDDKNIRIDFIDQQRTPNSEEDKKNDQLYDFSEKYSSVKVEQSHFDPSDFVKNVLKSKINEEPINNFNPTDEMNTFDDMFNLKELDRTLDGELDDSEIDIKHEKIQIEDYGIKDGSDLGDYEKIQKMSRLIIVPDSVNTGNIYEFTEEVENDSDD